MTPPRDTGTGRNEQAGGPVHILPVKAIKNTGAFSPTLKTPLKPLKPLSYSQTPSSTVKNSRSFEKPFYPHNPLILLPYSATPYGSAGGGVENLAPSELKPLTLPVLGIESRAGGYGGVASSLVLLTPSPQHHTLSEQRAGRAGGQA
jgi:hypothetical protein